MSYSRFWLSILSGDVASLEREGGRLGVGRLYGLLACMVAGRSWQAITTGLDRQRLTETEVRLILPRTEERYNNANL